jgi:hypothetical protein
MPAEASNFREAEGEADTLSPKFFKSFANLRASLEPIIRVCRGGEGGCFLGGMI